MPLAPLGSPSAQRILPSNNVAQLLQAKHTKLCRVWYGMLTYASGASIPAETRAGNNHAWLSKQHRGCVLFICMVCLQIPLGTIVSWPSGNMLIVRTLMGLVAG